MKKKTVIISISYVFCMISTILNFLFLSLQDKPMPLVIIICIIINLIILTFYVLYDTINS